MTEVDNWPVRRREDDSAYHWPGDGAELAVPAEIPIPSTLEQAVAVLDGVGGLILASHWGTAAIVYAYTTDEDRGGRPSNEDKNPTKSRQVSISEFATKQIRGLTTRDSVRKYRGAWQRAVDEGWAEPAEPGKQVMLPSEPFKKPKLDPPPKDHPASFNDLILDQVVDHLKEMGQSGTVLDPFAGIGRVHELRNRLDVKTVGVEIEPEWADKHPDTIQGNALELSKIIEPESVDAIVTSPTYGNRMADHHNAQDRSIRLTYKHTLGRDLHPDNSGQLQWSLEYLRFHRFAWAEVVATLKPGGTFTLNIKNHIRDGKEQRVAEFHLDTLYDLGMRLVALDAIPTKGVMAGENADARTSVEYVMTFRKDGIR